MTGNNLPPVSTTPVANYHRYHRWQIMGQNQAAETLKWTWRQKFIYMLTLLPKGDQTKLLTFFCLKIFSICHRCPWHRWCTLSREYLREFSKKFEMAVKVYSDAWENWFMKKPEVESLVSLQRLKQEWQKRLSGTRQIDGKNLVWFGKIERKLAKLSKSTFTCRSSS